MLEEVAEKKAIAFGRIEQSRPINLVDTYDRMKLS